MKSISILFLLITVILLSGMVSQDTSAYFIDTEVSTGNGLFDAVIAVTLLDDGFEGDPWDANWDDNGVTSWEHKKNTGHSGSYSAQCNKKNNGYLTSDNLDASGAVVINISFWFRPDSVEAGDMLVRLYDGSTYDTWYDLINYSTFQDGTWCYFSEEITNSQYFRSDFSLRFDSSALTDAGEGYRIDDVLITAKK